MSIFHLNCTLPPSISTFVTAPNSRGTLEILWNFLSVIVLCTWTVLHFNVPVHVVPSNTAGKYGLQFQRLLDKVKWMVLIVVAPELLLGKALFHNDCVSRPNAGTEARYDIQSNREPGVRHVDDQEGDIDGSISTSIGNSSGMVVPPTGCNCDGPGAVQRSLGISENQASSNEAVRSSSAIEARVERSSANLHYESLSSSLRRGFTLKDCFGKELKPLSTRYGNEIWRPDDRNTRLITMAMHRLIRNKPSLRLRSRQRNLIAL